MRNKVGNVFRWACIILAGAVLVGDYVIDRLGPDWKQHHSKEEVGLALAEFMATFGLAIAGVLLITVVISSFGSRLRRRQRERRERQKPPRKT